MPDPDHPLRETLRGIVRPPIAIPAESGRKKPVLTPPKAPDFGTRGILERARGSDSDPTPTPSARTALDAFLDEQEQRQEIEQMPDHEIARARRRRGPDVSAHADTHGTAPTPQEQTQAMQYLAGGYHPDGTARPALGTAVDRCARARLVGGPPLDVDPLAQACASTAAAAEARRLIHESIDAFKRSHPPQGAILAALERWRRTLRPGLVRRILTAIVPLEVQHRRDQAPRPQRPPGPDLSM